jgi:hypothetical protein
MKIPFIITISLLTAASIVIPCLALNHTPKAKIEPVDYQATVTPPKMGVEQINLLLGKKVTNMQGEELGFIKGILGEGGFINYVILNPGGLPHRDRLIPIPAIMIRGPHIKKTLIVNVEKNRLGAAPFFEKKDQPDFSNPDWNRKVYDYYGIEKRDNGLQRSYYLLIK